MSWRDAGLVVVLSAFGPSSCGASRPAAGDAHPPGGDAGADIGAADLPDSDAGVDVGAAAGRDGPIPLYCAATERSRIDLHSEVLILFDRSAEMSSDPTGSPCSTPGCSKWDQLVAAVEAIVVQTDSTIDWGLKLYPSATDACGVDSGADVAVGPGNAAAVINALAAARPGGGAPTRLAEAAAVTTLSDPTDVHPRYILLATGGLPSCMPGARDPAAPDVAGAVQAVSDAFGTGVPTFVLGVATTTDPTSDAALTDLAVAGGLRAMAEAAYYRTSDSGALLAPLTDSFGGGTCTVNLGDPPAGDTSNAAIDVFVDGSQVPRDTSDTSGWDYANLAGSQITLYGAPCEAVVSGDASRLTVAYRCVGG